MSFARHVQNRCWTGASVIRSRPTTITAYGRLRHLSPVVINNKPRAIYAVSPKRVAIYKSHDGVAVRPYFALDRLQYDDAFLNTKYDKD